MGKPLRVLLVEDVESDALLVVRALERDGFDVTFERVETEPTMSVALDRGRWDVVICDYTLPRFSAPDALALLQSRGLDLPFIILSGTVNEEIAVEVMRAGAHDFLSKGNYSRLSPAIERELREAKTRAESADMQEHLLISDRMASVGTLAAGVAHEINNPLAALMANLHFVVDELAKLRSDVERGKALDFDVSAKASRLREIEEPLTDAITCAERVRLIVRDLKLFSRSDDETRTAVDLRRVLELSIRMAWNEIRHRARLVQDYSVLPFVEGNEARFGQVFLNLVINAAQAIPEGRADVNEIRIVTRNEDDRFVVVEVHDTGCGIPESVLPRIFDPFFTTKPIGVGTGLGLAICHRIVTTFGGRISVDSQVGRGTVVRTVLPVATVRPDEPVKIASGLVVTRRGKVLVVDDELALATALRRMLSRDHDVVVVPGARAAIERISGGDRFDAILCDLMMPEVTGMDFHEEVSVIDADQAAKTIFMTGGAFTARAREFLARVGNPRIEKPFDANTVRAALRHLIQ